MRSKPRFPLAPQILLVVAVAILPCLAIVLWTASRLEAKAMEDAKGQCRFMAASVSNQERIIIASVEQVMLGTAMAPPVRDANAREVERLLQPLGSTNRYFSSMTLLDASGQEVASSLPGGQAGGADPKPVAAALARGRFALGGYHFSNGRPTLTAAVPIPVPGSSPDPRSATGPGPGANPGGVAAGALEAELDLEDLGDFIAFSGMPEAATVELCDRDGLLLFRHPGGGAGQAGSRIDARLWEALQVRRDGRTAILSLSGGRECLAGLESIDGDGDGVADLHVAAILPKDSTLAPLTSIMGTSISLVALAALLSLAFASIAARLSILARIKRLVAVAKDYEGGDLGARTGLGRGGDELGDLASALDAMADAIVQREKAQREALGRLGEALAEKDSLLKEVYHRVGNNLQVILSLMHLQADAVQDGVARALLGKNEGRILSMSLIHESLYGSGQYASIDFGTYIRSFVQQLLRNGGFGADGPAFVFETGAVQVDLERAIPMGLILNELLDNCLKHAFPDGPMGRVTVRLERTRGDGGEERIVLSVRDDGIGPPAGPAGWNPESLGLRLVLSLAGQLGGSFRLTGASPGSLAIVDMPAGPAQASGGRPPSGPPGP
jgi:two-component sensor histidine kinase